MFARTTSVLVVSFVLGACASMPDTHAINGPGQPPEAAAGEDAWSGLAPFGSVATAARLPAETAPPASPWPAVFEQAPVTAVKAYGCHTAGVLPQARELTRIRFQAYATEAPEHGAAAQVLKLAAHAVRHNAQPLFIAGTSYSPVEKPHRLLSLALARARSVAQALARNGVEPDRLTCVPFAGAEPPAPDWDKAAIIYLSDTDQG